MDKKQMKKELTDAARDGIARFLRTTRGAQLFGMEPQLATIDDTIQLRIKVVGVSGPVYFQVKVSAPI